jgi:hypothetical protein
VRLGALLIALAVLFVIGYATGIADLTAERLRELLAATAAPAPVVFIALFLVLNTVGLPAPLLSATAGVAFGVVVGTAVALPAMMLTATVQFLFARHVGGDRYGASWRTDSVASGRFSSAAAYGRLPPLAWWGLRSRSSTSPPGSPRSPPATSSSAPCWEVLRRWSSGPGSVRCSSAGEPEDDTRGRVRQHCGGPSATASVTRSGPRGTRIGGGRDTLCQLQAAAWACRA